ncbi:Ig-like domain-containing protein [Exiguobacterium indicum]|uniref:Ig-like domain-containing protein n=1 Tax=Exiguobacterium indicum TaxID=296995 RepID=UPI0009502849|nr:Ig-like domain-containing protein [Exiguobacterium indicum]
MGTKKSNKLYAAAAALAVTASAVAPGLTADAATKVTVKSVTNPASISHYGGYTFAVKKLSLPKTVKVLLSNKKYENRSVKWGKVSYDKKYIGKYQTISGTVSGTTKKASIKVKLNNYPVDVVEPKLAPVAVGEKLNLPSTIDVKYKDGKVIARSAKSFNLTAEKTDKAGEMKLSYNYMGKNSSIKGSIAYEVKAAEITNVMGEVKVDDLSVSADVKFPAKDAKAQLLIFPGKDESKALPAIDGKLENGKFTASGKNIPVGTHSFAIKIGDVVSPAKDFTIEAPMVKEVKAINGKDHVVEFNKAVDKITAENKANYEISVNNGAALATTAYTVAVDEKDPTKVKITLADTAALSNGAYVSVKVKKAILDKNLKPLADDFTKTFTFIDNSAAEIEKVEVDGNDLKVTFNDYVSEVGLVKVNGVVKAAAAASAYSKELVISGGATGLDNGTYSVQIANVKDIANINAASGAGTPNLTTFTSGNFTISNVTVAPTVSKVEKVDEDTFKITFNKPVTQPTVVAKKNGLDLTVAAPVSGAAGKEWTVTVSNNGGVALYNTGETSVNLALNISAFKAVADNVVGDAVNQSVTLSKDTTAPVVETRFNEIVDADSSATVNEVFNIKFDEVIGNLDASKIILTDKDGVRRTVSDANIVADSTGAFTILQVESTAVQAASGAILSGAYTIALGAGTVKDSALNSNAATSVSFTKATGTTTDFAVTATASANVITLPFGTPMTNSAIDLSNYKLDNKALPAGTIAYFDGSKNTVKIELPAGSVARTQAAVLTVSSSVVSEAGAKLDTASRNQVIATGLVDNVKPTLVSAKKLTSTTVEVTFSENLAAVTNAANTQDDFVVKINGVNFTVSAVADGTPNDNKVVLTVAPYNVDQTLTVAMADATINIADIANNTVEAKTVVTATK